MHDTPMPRPHRVRVHIFHARVFRALQFLNAGNFCLHTVSMDSDGVQPAWALGLKRSGLYYEGFIDNLEDTLEAHRRCTVTTYGTRTSKKSPASTVVPSSNTDQENDRYVANQKV